MSSSLIYEKKFPEVIARYLLNHFLLEAISADPSPSFPISYPDDPKFLSFFFRGMLQMCCICSVTQLIQEFILLVKFCAALPITLPLALHPQKHGTDVKSSLTLKSLLSFWSILLLDLLEYFRLCPFFPSSWWLAPERLVFTDITTEFLCIYHSQSIYFKFIFDFSRSLGITFVDVVEELRIVMNKSTEI